MAQRGGQAGACGVVCGLALVTLSMLVPAEAAAQTARVTGTVVDAMTNAPLAGGTVNLCASGQSCTQVTTSSTGTYTALVAAGTYEIFTTTFESQGFVNARHDGQMCPGTCGRTNRPSGATSVTITLAGRFQNFALARAGRIAGRVTDAASGAPVASAVIEAYAYEPTTALVRGTTDQNGMFDLRGLPPGNYGAMVRPTTQGYPTHTFGGLICVSNCAVQRAPQVISVTAGAVATADFALTPGAAISGVVVAAASQTPIAGVQVVASLDSGGQGLYMGQEFTDAQGRYRFRGLAAGRYRLLARSRSAPDQVFGGVVCDMPDTCNDIAGLGTPVDVTAGAVAANRNFELPAAAGLTGTVVDAGTGQPVTSGTVWVFRVLNGAAVSAALELVDAQGRYEVVALPPGQYVATFSSPSHPAVTLGGHVCGGGACSNAELLADAPVQVERTTVAGQDFRATRGGSIRVLVTDAGGAPLGDAAVSAVAHSPTPQIVARARTDASGIATLVRLAPGNYAVFAGGIGVVSRVAGGPICQSQPTCTPAEAVAVGQAVGVASNSISPVSLSLSAASGPPVTPFAPGAGADMSTVSVNMLRPRFGPVPTSYVLEAATTPGTPAVSLPMPLTGLTVPGVPPGVYFLRVRAVNQAGSSPPSPWTRFEVTDRLERPRGQIDVWMSGTRLMMSWDPGSNGPDSSYVIEVGSTSGRADIAQIPVAGSHFTYAPVPPGVYFVRLRARDSRGLGAPSPESMLVVGDAPAPPRPMGELHVRTEGSTVSFNWEPPAGGADDYLLEAGTDYGLSDIGTFALGRGTSFSVAGVPPGTYYVRLRARNARGLGLPSPPEDFEIK